MHIERIQIEDGFLDGLDLTLKPGLNVIIGSRGTGKTSLIELIRYALDVKGYTTETGKKSREHALSVLGAGRITLTLSDGARKITVVRSANDAGPQATGPFKPPIIFSQTEIETVGLQAGGRLRLLDSFIGDRRASDTAEAEASSEVRSVTAEAAVLRKEIDELARQVAELSSIDAQILELTPAEKGLAKVSEEAAVRKQKLDALSASIASLSVRSAALERFRGAITRWHSVLAQASAAPPAENWPPKAGEDPLPSQRNRVGLAQEHLRSALKEIDLARMETTTLVAEAAEQKMVTEEQGRQLRREMESLQAGAGDIIRKGQQLRERKAQLESLGGLLSSKRIQLQSLLAKRSSALNRLDVIRAARFQSRDAAAAKLNSTLGPRIKINAIREGQFETFAASIAEILRGSGLRYNDLSTAIAEAISPRELVEAVDEGDFEAISTVTSITKDRAARVISHLSDADLGALATVPLDDVVDFQLLDGSDYKDIADLSTGQRCTVVLPLVLRHTDRILIVDQPEDHIDNAFITDTLITAVLARQSDSQILFSTHNANIPVLGSADWVVQLGSDGRRGFAVAAAPLDATQVVRAITTIMEGGAEAFERRATFYNRHPK
jgi:energy-coupling factor transporter ATP-binding protein EcfA2